MEITTFILGLMEKSFITLSAGLMIFSFFYTSSRKVRRRYIHTCLNMIKDIKSNNLSIAANGVISTTNSVSNIFQTIYAKIFQNMIVSSVLISVMIPVGLIVFLVLKNKFIEAGIWLAASIAYPIMSVKLSKYLWQYFKFNGNGGIAYKSIFVSMFAFSPLLATELIRLKLIVPYPFSIFLSLLLIGIIAFIFAMAIWPRTKIDILEIVRKKASARLTENMAFIPLNIAYATLAAFAYSVLEPNIKYVNCELFFWANATAGSINSLIAIKALRMIEKSKNLKAIFIIIANFMTTASIMLTLIASAMMISLSKESGSFVGVLVSLIRMTNADLGMQILVLSSCVIPLSLFLYLLIKLIENTRNGLNLRIMLSKTRFSSPYNLDLLVCGCCTAVISLLKYIFDNRKIVDSIFSGIQ